jgi:hypothetical protein
MGALRHTPVEDAELHKSLIALNLVLANSEVCNLAALLNSFSSRPFKVNALLNRAGCDQEFFDVDMDEQNNLLVVAEKT